MLQLNGVHDQKTQAVGDRFMLDVRVNDKNISMEVDTGAAVTVVPKNILHPTSKDRLDPQISNWSAAGIGEETKVIAQVNGPRTNYIHSKGGMSIVI